MSMSRGLQLASFAACAGAASAYFSLPVTPRTAPAAPEEVSSEEMALAVSTGTASGTLELALSNRKNLAYSAQIKLGTPPQELDVDLNTAGWELFVPASHLVAASEDSSTFDVSKSSTAEATVRDYEFDFIPGKSGRFYKDTLQVGGATFKRFPFALINNATTLRAMGPTGGLGLGVNYAIGKKSPFLEALLEEVSLDKQVMGFYLPKNAPGEVTFGGVNKDHVDGAFSWFALQEQWTGLTVNLDSVAAGALAVTKNSNMFISTGTSLIEGPAEAVRVLMWSMGAFQLKTRGGQKLWVADCNKISPVTFTLSGTKFVMDVDDLTILKSSPYCVIGIKEAPAAQSNGWIMGMLFLHKYYLQVDFGDKYLGLARAAEPALRLI